MSDEAKGTSGAKGNGNGTQNGGYVVNPGVTDLHACMGLNSCRCQDRTGDAAIAGSGKCATVQHLCHGVNECRTQGGCGYLGTPAQQGVPAANECRGFGSCAVPINEGRVSSAGFNKGKSVWRLARERFEQRMYEIGKPFGDSIHGQGIPDEVVPGWYTKGSPDSGGSCCARKPEGSCSAKKSDGGT